MILSESQAKKVIESPRSKTALEDSLLYESRLRVFTQSMTLDELNQETGWAYFKKEIVDSLTKKKADRISNFINFPLSVVDISDNVLTETTKVFDSKNSFVSVSATDDIRNQFTDEVIESLNIFDWIKKNGTDVLNNQPNSVVVVDYDSEGNPFLIYVSTERIVDFQLSSKCGELDYFAFIHSVHQLNETDSITYYAVYDSYTYWVFSALNGDKTKLDLVSQLENYSGQCPARMFMSDSLNGGYNRRVPLSTSMSKLSEWQRFNVFKSYADHYYPFPVIERVEENCSVEGCQGGHILTGHRDYEDDGIKYNTPIFTDCPSCSSKKDSLGPGLVVQLKSRSQKDDPDYSGDFKMITPDVSSLEYIAKKLESLEANIIYNSAGYNELLNKEAVNSQQVQGSFESKTNVLIRIKNNFDTLHKWIVEQIMLGSFGDLANVSVNVNYGTEFYIYTEAEIQAVFDTAKKSNLPESEIAEIYLQIVETKYKGNPDKILRAITLFNLDPLPFDSWIDTQSKYNSGIISDEQFEIKANFTNLVARFERENATVTKFGSLLDFDIRIIEIQKIIKTYLNGRQERNQERNQEGQEGSGNGS